MLSTHTFTYDWFSNNHNSVILIPSDKTYFSHPTKHFIVFARKQEQSFACEWATKIQVQIAQKMLNLRFGDYMLIEAVTFNSKGIGITKVDTTKWDILQSLLEDVFSEHFTLAEVSFENGK